MKKYFLLTILPILLCFSNGYSHRGEFLTVENVKITEKISSYVFKFDLYNVKDIDLTDIKLEFWVNGIPVKWKNIELISSNEKVTTGKFKIYKNIFNKDKDYFQIEITKLFNRNNDWGGYDSPIPVQNNTRQKNEIGYEVIADVPWRMPLKDDQGNVNGIPVHVFVHDANGVLGTVKLDWIDIRVKNAGLTNFGNVLTYNSMSDANYKNMFSCRSLNDGPLEIQEFELSAFSKSTNHTIDFDKTDPLVGPDHFKLDQKFAYITFTIPPSSLVGFSDAIDVEIEMALKDKPDRTYRFRIFRSNENIPSQNGWYRGDTHLHSVYTQNSAETGLPLCATKEAGKLIGLDWITTTDHTSDIDNYGTTIQSNWNRVLQDIKDHNLEDNSMLYIPGQEVAVNNTQGKLVHMLAYPGYSNPQNFPFLGDGKGDVSGTDVYVDNVIAALSSFNGFSYAAHPFSTADKLPTIPVGGGIWNLKDSTFADNSDNYPLIGGNIICNDLNEPTDIFSSDSKKYIKDALKGGQIWNVRNVLETSDDDRDPWDVINDNGNDEFSPVDTASYSFHIKKFRQGQEVINHINKEGLYLKNQNPNLQNWKFYMSAGSDAHGSFNFSNTDDFGGFGSIHDNAVGKLTTVTYCPDGMGANGENVLEAMYKGHTTLSDGPLVTIGVSTDAKSDDNELLMGDDGIVNTILIDDYDFNLNYTTTQEFGDVKKLILIVGTENGEISKSINFSQLNGNNILSYKLKTILDSVFIGGIPNDKNFYVRVEMQTQVTGLTNDVHRITYQNYWSFSNPIWLQFKKIPLPTNFDITVYPNPTDGDFSLLIENPTKGDISIELYDNLGNLVYSLNEYVVEKQVINFNANKLNLAKGAYFIKGQIGDNKKTVKMIRF